MEIEISRLLISHRHILDKYHVRKLGLFGSHARGDETRESDIDLLVDFEDSAFGPDFAGYFDAMTSLVDELEGILHARVDLVTPDMLSPHIAPQILSEVRYVVCR